MEASAGYFIAQNPSGTLYKVQNVSEADLPEGSLAVFQQRGVVMKEDYCGMAGTATIREAVLQTMVSPKVMGGIMVADSPGGAVNGTGELTDAIYASKKPIIGFADGLAASAAYEMLSGCGEIYASHDSAVVGSIGVLVTLRDFSERLKDLGVREETFVASTSPDKTAMWDEALEGNPAKLDAHLVATHQLFKDTVKRTRSEVTEEALKGGVFLANEAIDHDLIDGI
jgi:protease-4